MSKKRKRDSRPAAGAQAKDKDTPAPPALPLKRWQAPAIVLIVLLAGIPFVVGKYCEISVPGPFDSGSNVYSAQHILDGAEIGVNERLSAGYGTLLANMLGVLLFGFSDVGPKVVQGLLQAGALVALFFALRRSFGLVAAGVAVVVASFYVSAPLIAKFGNVKEQFLIACAMMGLSFLILRHTGGRWFWPLLAGAALAWGPLFKETGIAAIGAAGLFLLLQPLLKNRSWKQTGIDFGLVIAGGIVAVAPLFGWLGAAHPRAPMPYASIINEGRSALKQFVPQKPAAPKRAPSGATDANEPNAPAGSKASYVQAARAAYSLSRQAGVVYRYYRALAAPILLGLAAVIIWLVRKALAIFRKLPDPDPAADMDRFVPLLGLWWVLDMAFVWISPRPYEQYYLPLTASGAAVGAYAVGWLVRMGLSHRVRVPYIVGGGVVALMLLVPSWRVVYGFRYSPYSGQEYPERRRGYSQQIDEAEAYNDHPDLVPWIAAGRYIRENSTPDDLIYVWGWYPGIYVQARRFSNVPHAFYSEMHMVSPASLSGEVKQILTAFAKHPPKFIVDSRKVHDPYDRPPLEIWPITDRGPLQPNRFAVEDFERDYPRQLRAALIQTLTRGGSTPEQAARQADLEVQRFAAMRPLRDYVMAHYVPVKAFGDHILFQRADTVPGRSR